MCLYMHTRSKMWMHFFFLEELQNVNKGSSPGPIPDHLLIGNSPFRGSLSLFFGAKTIPITASFFLWLFLIPPNYDSYFSLILKMKTPKPRILYYSLPSHEPTLPLLTLSHKSSESYLGFCMVVLSLYYFVSLCNSKVIFTLIFHLNLYLSCYGY